jgi:hypothetical protein
MTNLENFKDIRTVASVSALVAVGISSSYFYNEILEIKKDLVEMKKHLSAVIGLSSPDTARNMTNHGKAIEQLDLRLAKALDDIKILRQNAAISDGTQPPKRVYNRLTQKTDDSGFTAKPKFVTQHIEKEENEDDDIAAMMM